MQQIPLAIGRPVSAGGGLLKTGQTTRYSSELDDGYYQKGTAKSYTVNTTGAQAGTTNVDLAHLVDTGISFDNATKELRCAGKCGVFKAAGGETIVVSGSSVPANNAAWTTASATADKVVLTTAPTDESAGASITVAKREAISNNTVLDNVTGLTWLRYRSETMGSAGNGKMPWTGVVYDIFAFCAAANAAVLGGFSDWRIANVFELFSIADFEQPSGYPDSTAFPSTPSSTLITSTTRVNSSASCQYVSFYECLVSYTLKIAENQVMLVRGG